MPETVEEDTFSAERVGSGGDDATNDALGAGQERGSHFPPGAQIVVRDEEWLVRSVTATRRDGQAIYATGVSELVRDQEAVFFTKLDTIDLLDPEETRLVSDSSAQFRKSRLFLEAVLRKTPLPQSERGLALADNFLMDIKTHQQRPAELALSMRNLRPRLLVADVVGLGKTLEIGLILGELIRRGRGERILVVTPQQVLEQFQRELWTRFSIPLVRLDSLGIQRMQQKIPAGRNPFAHFRRVIVSVDTLKNADLYGHHLRATKWDAVVVDESHNLINPGSLRNQLVQVLASQTDALLFASATPHNGDGKSFAELLQLLDPTAIKDAKAWAEEERGNAEAAARKQREIAHLYIRRTKVSPEVRESIDSDEWAERGPSIPVNCPATGREEEIFEELAKSWLPAPGSTAVSATDERLFAYQLVKAHLSSHKALAATVRARLDLEKPGKGGKPRKELDPREIVALERLCVLVEGFRDEDSAKLGALVDHLKEIGVGPGENTPRVVIFSERVATLKWLAQIVPPRLGFAPDPARKPGDADTFNGAVNILYGDTGDVELLKIIEGFGLEKAPARLLFTGDLASEGVNLHRECHHLIHYDIPWSLIRIEQRNGRIDRYGQAYTPVFRAMLLKSSCPWYVTKDGEQVGVPDDSTVSAKLIQREEQALRAIGTAEAVTGLYSAKKEEERIVSDLLAGRTVEQSLASTPATQNDVLAGLLGQVGAAPARPEVAKALVPSLFASSKHYFDAALEEVFDRAAQAELDISRSEQGLLSLVPPADLRLRLSALPAEYLADQKVNQRFKLTFDPVLGKHRLRAALRDSGSQWPNVSYVSDIHPVLDWITDKVLVSLKRQQAPVITTGTGQTKFLVQGVYSNGLGRPIVVEWLAVTGLPDHPVVGSMGDALESADLARLDNAAAPRDMPALQRWVPAAIQAARRHMKMREAEWAEQVVESLREARARVGSVSEQASIFAAPGAKSESKIDQMLREQSELLERLGIHGDPMLRLLAVLEGAR